MAEWTNEASAYLDGYLMQVAALARHRDDDDIEVVEGLRAHIVEDAAARADGIVEVDHVLATIAVVGTPEQICGGAPPPRRQRLRRADGSWTKVALAGMVLGCAVVLAIPALLVVALLFVS